MSHSFTSSFKQNLIWHLLFIDALFLLLRYGGIAVVDLIFHAFFLLAATILLALRRRVYQPPKIYYWIFGGVMAIALIQLVPLPGFLFGMLAPVKQRIMETVSGIFPNIPMTTEITVLRDYHMFKTASLALDCYLILLMIMAPKPSRSLFRFWCPVFSLTVGSLAIIAHSDGAAGEALLGWYKGTYGGLVNRNHFAAFTGILMLFNMQQVLASVVQIRDEYKERESDTSVILRHGLFVLCCLCCMLMLFLGFRTAASRSGIINMVVIHGIFLLMLLVYWWRKGVARKTVMTLGVLLVVSGVSLLLFLPLGKSIDKLEREGIHFSNRLAFNKIGVSYLMEMPVLGTGIGSTESLLAPVEPKPYHKFANARKYHNEFLQTTVEFGLPGLALLILFLGRIGRSLWAATDISDFYRKTFLFGVISMCCMLAILSLFSFPLRITSIRVFILMVVFIGIKIGWSERERNARKLPYLAAFTPLALFALLHLFMLFKTPLGLEAQAIKEVRETVKYGTAYKVDFFVANNRMRDILVNPQQDAEVISETLEGIKKLVSSHLTSNPFNIKAMNLLFMAEVMEEKMEDPGYNPERFAAAKQRALTIRALGKDANINSKLSLLFLYAANEEWLTEAEIVEYQEIKKAYDWNLRVANNRLERRRKALEEEKQEDNNRGDQ